MGDLLRAAREESGLSQGDIASRLRMGVKQVRALEQNDFAALPKGTFLRGFVRNFAKEAGVKPEHALGLLEGTHREAAAVIASAVVVPSQQNIKVPLAGGEMATPPARVLIAVVIAGFFLAAFWYWWEFVRPHLAEGGRPRAVAEVNSPGMQTPLSAPPANALAADVGVLPESNASTSSTLPLDASSSISGTAVTEPADIAKPVVRPAMAAGGGSLGFTFSGDSWVEVADGSGKIVLSKKFKAGDAEEIAGRPPFSVVIGNAQVSRMAHNGKEIDLVPHTRVSVARVTVK